MRRILKKLGVQRDDAVEWVIDTQRVLVYGNTALATQAEEAVKAAPRRCYPN